MSADTDLPFSIWVFLEESISQHRSVRDDSREDWAWLTSSSAGGIIQASSYKVAFYAMGGAFGLALIMIFFWMPETAYVRTGVVNLDTGSNNVGFPLVRVGLHSMLIFPGND
jgi:hypothetical protein